jgi:hypothetical protein
MGSLLVNKSSCPEQPFGSRDGDNKADEENVLKRKAQEYGIIIFFFF